MSKVNRLRWGGRTGTVTVLEARVHRTSARNARIAFYLSTTLVAMLATLVLSDRIHPILALLAGLLLGAVVGAVVWVAVRAWPIVRYLWWWATEITVATGLLLGWTALAQHTDLIIRAVILLGIGALFAVSPTLRRAAMSIIWCLVVRHRLRVCFNQFIIANRSGSLPLILWARPTPVGERVWVYLRPGLSLADIDNRLDKVAAACHATAVTAARAGATQHNAAYLCIDIRRRDVLTGLVTSPLSDDTSTGTPTATVAPPRPDRGGLNLGDIPLATVRPMRAIKAHAAITPAAAPPAPPTVEAGQVVVNGDDVTEWI